MEDHLMSRSTEVPKKKRPILKYILVGLGTILAAILSVILWTYVSLTSGPDLMDISHFHPFRSPQAKQDYLSSYDERAEHWPVPSETKSVATSHGTTFVRISGPLDAKPLVLLPGGGTSSLMWIPNIKGLSKSYRTYAVDNIYGNGRSIFTQRFDSAADFTGWLNELFDSLGLGSDVSMAGLSYGGWITAEYALRYPDRVRKCVLIAPAATVLPFSTEFIKNLILAILPPRYFLKNVMYWLMEDLANKDEESRRVLESVIDDAMLARQSFKFKALVDPRVLTDEELRRSKVPTLFLVGENEKIYQPAEAIRRLNDVAPGISTEMLANCGHDLTFVHSELLNERILRFLE
jgi:pimeloyl-ACP methyl ester carboxylesterase